MSHENIRIHVHDRHDHLVDVVVTVHGNEVARVVAEPTLDSIVSQLGTVVEMRMAFSIAGSVVEQN